MYNKMNKTWFEMFSLFNEIGKEFAKQINSLDLVEDNNNTKKENKNTYSQSLYEEYKDNELVNRKEVIYDNGKKIKDVEYKKNNNQFQEESKTDNMKCCENKCVSKCNKEDKYQQYIDEIANLKAELDSKNKEIEKLKESLNEYIGTTTIQNNVLEQLTEKLSVYRELEEKFNITKRK